MALTKSNIWQNRHHRITRCGALGTVQVLHKPSRGRGSQPNAYCLQGDEESGKFRGCPPILRGDATTWNKLAELIDFSLII